MLYEKKLKRKISKILKELNLNNLKSKNDELSVEIEELRHNFYLFQVYISEYKALCEDNSLFESENTKQKAIKDLKELYYNILIVDNRIKTNINKIQNLLNKKVLITQAFVDTTNQSFLDMFTNYEITVARYSKFLFKFKISPEPKKLKEPMRDLVKSMENLNSIVKKFNKENKYKLLQPFEESETANTVYNYGFNIISEKDWTKLVKYRG